MHDLQNRREQGERTPEGRWTPGTSGNPNGRPKGGASVAAALRRAVDEDAANRLAVALIERALAGDFRAWKIIADRIDGPVTPTTAAPIDGIEVRYTYGPKPAWMERLERERGDSEG